MNTKHTPGPWRIAAETWYLDFGTYGAVVYLRDSGTVANIPDDLIRYETRARLIAAAPELLAALQGITAQLEPYIEDEEDTDIRDRLVAWVNGARAAIAKAKGESE